MGEAGDSRSRNMWLLVQVLMGQGTREGLEAGLGLSSEPVAQPGLPSSKFYNLPKQHHQLVIKCSNTRHSTCKSHHFLMPGSHGKKPCCFYDFKGHVKIFVMNEAMMLNHLTSVDVS